MQDSVENARYMSPRQRLSDIAVRVDHRTPDDPTPTASRSACDEGGLVALQVLGNDMLPEFEHGDVVVIEPDGRIEDGAFVVAKPAGEWMLRQLRANGSSWRLVALDPAVEVVDIADPGLIFGVVIQKSKPGRRRSVKRYDQGRATTSPYNAG